MPTKEEIEAAAVVIRRRCCRAADGRDIREPEDQQIARDILTAAETARSGIRPQETLGAMDW